MKRHNRRDGATALLAGACLLATVAGWPAPARQDVAGVGARPPQSPAPRTPAPAALVATVRVGDNPDLLAVDERSGHVFVVNYEAGNYDAGTLSILEGRTGRLMRTVSVIVHPAAIVVDQRTARVFVAGDGLSVLDTRTGRLVTTLASPGVPRTMPGALAVNERAGEVYVADSDNVDVLDAATGRLRRRIVADTGPEAIQTIVVDPLQSRAYVVSDRVAVLDTARGRVVSTLPFFSDASPDTVAPEQITVVPRAGRILYVRPGLHLSTLDALDVRSGIAQYTIGVGDSGLDIVAVDAWSGRVFLGIGDQMSFRLDLLDAATGRGGPSVWLGPVSYPIGLTDAFQGSALDRWTQRVYLGVAPRDRFGTPITTAPGQLLTLDATTLRVLSRTPVGPGPDAVAVDPPRHRVFVANGSDNTVSVFDTTRLAPPDHPATTPTPSPTPATPTPTPTAGWQAQTTGATSALAGVACPWVTTCYAVGAEGVILATADRGQTWQRQRNPLAASCAGDATTGLPGCAASVLLASVACPRIDVCYAVGTQDTGSGPAGAILGTTDLGQTWRAQRSAATSSLSSIACPWVTTCYATGDGGTLLATTDGGRVWRSQPSGARVDLAGLACPRVTSCYAVGDSGVIVATTDGGRHWQRQRSAVSTALWAIACPGVARCYAVGERGVIVATADGGQTWQRQPSGTRDALRGVACASGWRCVAVGTGGTIATTLSGGDLWASQRVQATLRAVTCVGTGWCVAVGSCTAVGPLGCFLTQPHPNGRLAGSDHRRDVRPRRGRLPLGHHLLCRGSGGRHPGHGGPGPDLAPFHTQRGP